MLVGPLARVANQHVRSFTFNATRAFNHVAYVLLTSTEAVVDVSSADAHMVAPGGKVGIESAAGQINERAAKLGPAIRGSTFQKILCRVDGNLPTQDGSSGIQQEAR